MANLITTPALKDPLAYFPNFLWKAWRTIGLPDPTPLQYDFAHYLDGGYMAELMGHAAKGDEGAAKILMAFRGASKSYVTTSYSVCRLRRNREELVLVVSATGGFAGGIANFAFQMVNNFEWLADMKPRSDQRQSALKFDVAGCPPAVKDESFASEGLFGQITGRRASCIIGDDLETPNTSDTEGKRAILESRMGELKGAILKPGGDMYLLGTAQTEDTIYKKYAEDKGFELRIYPIVYPRPSTDPKLDELRHYGPRLAPWIRKALDANPHLAGTSVEPTRFSEADILGRKKVWGRVEFERQFLMYLNAQTGRGNPLRLRDLVVLELAPPPHSSTQVKLPSEVTWAPTPQLALDIPVDSLSGDSHLYAPASAEVWIEAEETVCFVDTSGQGLDETTWTILAGSLGRVALCWQGKSLEGHTPATMKAIAADCKRWGVRMIEVEQNFGGGMFADLLTPQLADINHPCAVETIPAGMTMKEKRIVETLEPVITDHRLLVNAQVFREDYQVAYEDVEERDRRFYRLTYQLTRMVPTKGAVKHDDRADGVAGGVRHFIGVLLRQVTAAAQEGRLKAIDKEAEDLIESRRKQGLHLWGLEKIVKAFGRGSPKSSRRDMPVK